MLNHYQGLPFGVTCDLKTRNKTYFKFQISIIHAQSASGSPSELHNFAIHQKGTQRILVHRGEATVVENDAIFRAGLFLQERVQLPFSVLVAIQEIELHTEHGTRRLTVLHHVQDLILSGRRDSYGLGNVKDVRLTVYELGDIVSKFPTLRTFHPDYLVLKGSFLTWNSTKPLTTLCLNQVDFTWAYWNETNTNSLSPDSKGTCGIIDVLRLFRPIENLFLARVKCCASCSRQYTSQGPLASTKLNEWL